MRAALSPARTSTDFLPVAREANRRGFAVAATLLGESIRDAAEAPQVADEYCGLLQAFAQEGLDANVAFKLTHVGLDISPELALENASRIAAQAKATKNTMRLDMEQSRTSTDPADLPRACRNATAAPASYCSRISIAARRDLRAMLPSAPNIRIVKGAYLEPPVGRVCPKARRGRKLHQACRARTFGRWLYRHRDARSRRSSLASKSSRRPAACPSAGASSFRCSTGSPSRLRAASSKRGYRVRLSIPYGSFWFPYLMRRLAERPANVAFFLKNAMRRG